MKQIWIINQDKGETNKEFSHRINEIVYRMSQQNIIVDDIIYTHSTPSYPQVVLKYSLKIDEYINGTNTDEYKDYVNTTGLDNIGEPIF